MNFQDKNQLDVIDALISRHVCSNLVEQPLSKACASAELVSFDFFDTLFRRPFIKPTDLFLYMQETRNLHDFYFRRLQAEMVARRKHSNKIDIDISEIYDYLPETPDMELMLEELILYPRNDISDLFLEVQSRGLKTAVLSDVYLPKNLIAKILGKHGLSPDFLYVSGTDNVGKFDGSMFRELLKDCNLGPGSIIHIGDNLHSDFKIPRKFGMVCSPLFPEVYIVRPGFFRVYNKLDKQIAKLACFAASRSDPRLPVSATNRQLLVELGRLSCRPIVNFVCRLDPNAS